MPAHKDKLRDRHSKTIQKAEKENTRSEERVSVAYVASQSPIRIAQTTAETEGRKEKNTKILT